MTNFSALEGMCESKWKIPKESEYILRNQANALNIENASSQSITDLTQVIIKNIFEDRKYRAITIGRRLLYACPYYEKNEDSDGH